MCFLLRVYCLHVCVTLIRFFDGRKGITKTALGIEQLFNDTIVRYSEAANLVMLCACVFCAATSAASCRKSLGMHSGAIPDDAITASSSYDIISVGPAFGRYPVLLSYFPLTQITVLI